MVMTKTETSWWAVNSYRSVLACWWANWAGPSTEEMSACLPTTERGLAHMATMTGFVWQVHEPGRLINPARTRSALLVLVGFCYISSPLGTVVG
jgi:hypothetical protein